MLKALVEGIADRLPGHRSRPVVSVVRLSGVIAPLGRRGSLNMQSVVPALERAFTRPHVKAVALLINSPGGSAAQSMLLYHRIRALAAEKSLPVLAFAEDAAASGGYMLACAADEIFASESSIVGSVGVIAATFGFQDLMVRLGVERRVYTAGDRKVLLDPFQPAQPDDIKRLGEVQADIHEAFKAIVRESRGARLKGDEALLFSGAFWTGRQGLALGLIDGVADLRSELRRRFGARVKLRVSEPVPKKTRLPLGFLRKMQGSEADGVRAPAYILGVLIPAAFEALEERAWWTRLGL